MRRYLHGPSESGGSELQACFHHAFRLNGRGEGSVSGGFLGSRVLDAKGSRVRIENVRKVILWSMFLSGVMCFPDSDP